MRPAEERLSRFFLVLVNGPFHERMSAGATGCHDHCKLFESLCGRPPTVGCEDLELFGVHALSELSSNVIFVSAHTVRQQPTVSHVLHERLEYEPPEVTHWRFAWRENKIQKASRC